MTQAVHDVAIIGAGGAGLSAALILGRSCRRVIVYDSGEPRNAVARHMHGFLSREGMPPAEFRRTAREDMIPFGIQFEDSQQVLSARAGDLFELGLSSGNTAYARKLVLATGAADILPEIEGLRELWGGDVFSCPYCHGWEVRDQRLVVLGTGGEALEQTTLLTAWTSEIVLCTNGPAEFTAEQKAKLASTGANLREQPIERMVAAGGRLEGIRFTDGEFVACRGVMLRPKTEYRTGLAQQLGCELTEAGAIRTDDKGRTNVIGVFAAGNCTGPGQVIIAAAQGAKAAYEINNQLIEEKLRVASAVPAG